MTQQNQWGASLSKLPRKIVFFLWFIIQLEAKSWRSSQIFWPYTRSADKMPKIMWKFLVSWTLNIVLQPKAAERKVISIALGNLANATAVTAKASGLEKRQCSSTKWICSNINYYCYGTRHHQKNINWFSLLIIFFALFIYYLFIYLFIALLIGCVTIEFTWSP